MPTIPITVPATGTAPWKPSKAQVLAAALAYARLDESGWRRLEPSQRDDYLIDAHAALVAAHRARPPGGDAVVCMTKDHADAYHGLVIAVESVLASNVTNKHAALELLRGAHARIQSLTSPEGNTP